MKHSAIKGVITFLLVLVLTVCTVAALSMVTQAKTETASERYVQEVRTGQSQEVNELSAAAPEGKASPLASLGGVLLLLSIPCAGLLIFRSAMRRGKDLRKQLGRRRYSPRADMAFQTLSTKERV